MNGTSMATPHVSGVAALYFEAFPNLTATEIWLKIEKNAKSLEGQRFRDVGAGIIQVV
jgi:subtilisin family serine protease